MENCLKTGMTPEEKSLILLRAYNEELETKLNKVIEFINEHKYNTLKRANRDYDKDMDEILEILKQRLTIL